MNSVSYGSSLLPYNTFRIDCICPIIHHISSVDHLLSLDSAVLESARILGGGSNILCASRIEEPVLKNEILGVEVVDENEDSVSLKVGGGENWHDFVQYCVENNYGGLENLSLIPGTVGAAPVQNIGAYGVEQDQLFVSLDAIDLHDKTQHTFTKSDCQFAYRDSFFKSKVKGRFFITHVTYTLRKRHHIHNVSYGAISNQLEERGISSPTIRDISEVVMAIRTHKLPDPTQVANAGSFFKNPVLLKDQFDHLLANRTDLVFYELEDGTYKIPAGWLIDQCGYRGKQKGQVGCYRHQALVIVNHGGATGEAIWAFAREIQSVVMDTFGILLIPEVNRWGL